MSEHEISAPTPNDLVHLRCEIERELNERIHIDIYHGRLGLSLAIKSIVAETIRKTFKLKDTTTIVAEYIHDEYPKILVVRENAGTVSGGLVTLRDISVTDVVMLKIYIDEKAIAIKVYIEYGARELIVNSIHMLKLLTPIYVEDIKIKAIGVGEQ
jgi:hypothetical protein